MQSAELIADDVWDASASLDRALGPLAGLLIAKWAGYDESEREAIAAFNEEAFTPELPQALSLSAWRDPSTGHAGEVAEALRGMAARNGAVNAAARYTVRVAPLVTHTAERSPPTYERLYACVRQVDFGTIGGRTLAARLFDDALRTVMATRGRVAGEFATPQQVAALMLDLADLEPGHRVYDPCFGFGELLVGAARRLREAARGASPRDWADVQHAGVFGVEINPLSYAVGLCRILLAGIDGPRLELSDTLERPLPRNRSADGFDRILATPPWGGTDRALFFGSVPIPEPQFGDPFSSARDGESSSRRKSRCRVAGRSTGPTRLRPAREKGAGVGFQHRCRGLAAGWRIRALDRHCRQPDRVSARSTSIDGSFRLRLILGMASSGATRRPCPSRR